MTLSIIIPLYNEAELISTVLNKLFSIQYPSSISQVEIIVVDDSSTDNSHQVVEQITNQKHPFQITLLKHSVNKGKGAAVKTGINTSTGNIILIQDADLELSPEDIPKLIEVMDLLKVEFINGSRYLPGVYRPLSSYRRYIANKLFTLMTSVLIDVKLTDMACGYKLFTRELYDKITIKADRFGFEAELIIKALKIKKNNIAEVPVKYFPRNEGEGKKLKNIDGFKILFTIIKYGLFRAK
jgi:glycosyltransferase involved in cell wall biosynthesis